MSTPDFNQVIKAWDSADESEIHPLWDVDKGEFWDSGWSQAQDVVEFARPGARVVDFGAGNGRVTLPLSTLGFDLWAVDASANMLAKLKQNAKEQGAKMSYAQSDGSDLAAKLGKKKADVILARAVLIHHDHDSVANIVTGLAAALKKGGVLIADWPVGEPHVRPAFNRVTVWDPAHREEVAKTAGLTPVRVDQDPSVWRKV